MIELHNLNKTYGATVALNLDKLSIHKGESIGLVGNNGAGKTTMLSLILDLIKASHGYVTSKSIKVAEHDAWKKYTGSFLDESFLIPFLTPVEYLVFVGKLSGLTPADALDFIQEHKSFFHDDLGGKRKLIRDLSKGNKNKLGILGALISNPELLILDEPFANLDPSSQEWLKYKIKLLNDGGTTMIISSHIINHVTEISSRLILLENGKIVRDLENTESAATELEEYFSMGIGY